MANSTHICGGTILTGGSGELAHQYCDRCGAYTHDMDTDVLPTGTDLEANGRAWDAGDEESPEADHAAAAARIGGAVMVPAMDIVRQIVGRRHRVTRAEMRAILGALPDLVESSTITGRFSDGRLYVGGAAVEAHEERTATAREWERLCRGIMIISVMSNGVRFDEPGSMAPGQHAEVMFMSAEAAARQATTDYLRPKAGRLLIVTDDRHG